MILTVLIEFKISPSGRDDKRVMIFNHYKSSLWSENLWSESP